MWSEVKWSDDLGWNSKKKSLAYMSLVRPILEYGTSFWDPYREGQIHALDRVQKKAAIFVKH